MTNAPEDAGRPHRLAVAATLLSITACYGTLLVIGALSLLGVGLSLHTGAWAGVIVAFAFAAVAGVALGYRRHRTAAPLLLSVAGACLITWVMLGSFSRLLELAGFAMLIAAAAWDWRLQKNAASKQR